MKVKFGSLIVAGSGKIGGHVVARNRSGSYMRTKSTPNNPQTPAQTLARGSLATFSSNWRALTQAQRNAWNGAVEGFKGTNVFGDLVTPTGKNLYTRLNVNIALVSGSPIVLPPEPTSIPSPTGLGLTAVGAGAVTLSGTVTLTVDMIIEATPQLSAGVGFFKNKFRVIDTEVAGVTAPIVITTPYSNKFGAPIQGMKMAVRLTSIDAATGITSTPVVLSAIAS